MSSQTVMDRLRSNRVGWAFIDLREPGEVAEGHPFASVNVPYSRLEADFPRLVPSRSVPVVLFDAGDGVAERAAAILTGAGWSDLAIVDGGAHAWVAAGLPLIKGEHSFSKAFGEWVQHAFHVAEIGPDDLAARMGRADAPLLVDGRPLSEHRAFTLPGSVNCPNAELGLRLQPGPVAGKDIVVHCAGRTRSIIGAQTLCDFGITDRPLALRDGTQGWELSGRKRETGVARPIAEPDAAARDAATERARAVMLRHGISAIGAATAAAWAHDPTRVTFFLDPRPEEEGDTPPGFRRAPGTTLVQQTDRFIGVRGARVVLWDPGLVRSVFAALWLGRMGFDAHVLTENPPALPAGPLIAPPSPPPEISAAELARMSGAVLLDLRPAAAFRSAHPRGARRALRPRLPALDLPSRSTICLIAETVAQAAPVAADLGRAGHRVAGVCTATPDDWVSAGIDISTGTADAVRDIDEVHFCAGRHKGNLDDARAYLDWETGLLDRLSSAGLAFWPAFPNPKHKSAGA